MNVSQEDARESLTVIEDVTTKTRRAVAASYASGLLILWGLIWLIGFASVHFYTRWSLYIFNTLNAIGFGVTILIFRSWRTRASTKSPASRKIHWRIFGFWFLLFVYACLWLLLLEPFQGIQTCAFFCTLAMFGYIVIGLWFDSYFMLYLGLTVTALIVLGFYLLPSYFYLWMAPTGGGALLGTGLYIRIRWN